MAQSLNLGARWKGQAARLRDASHRRLRRGLTLMVPAVMLFVLLGVAPGTDVLAHFGGFCCGAMLGLPLSFLDNPARSNRLNLVAGALFGLVTLASWWLALARAAP